MKTGDVVYHMPTSHISPMTPYELEFMRTVNGHELDPAGLFRHTHNRDNEFALLFYYHEASVYPTPQEAIQAAIGSLAGQIVKLSEMLDAYPNKINPLDVLSAAGQSESDRVAAMAEKLPISGETVGESVRSVENVDGVQDT